ncbi:MAG: DNRLRE domain-containing protein, partial [Chloroflexaceae bacterium]
MLVIIITVSALPAPLTQAQTTTTTVDLSATDDARTQLESPDANFASDALRFITLNGHFVFVKFDLLALPRNATVISAELQLEVYGVNTGPNEVEVGRALPQTTPWQEEDLTWTTQPGVTWGGPVQAINSAGTVSWDVTALVQGWHSGNVVNNGFAMRGNGGDQVTARSKENGDGPQLIITYQLTPPEGAQPDLGDAPDSSNNVGVSPNTAYPGVPGQFPTVWNGTPAGQPAGPRHANQSGEGILGQYLSREVEADSGADQDGANNILDGGANNADNDRGDDGWRKRNVSFDHCAPTTLRVRVSKAQAAALNRMYLNVWFDGNRDDDWDDRATCTPDGEQLAIPATEWIVQDYYVD